MKLNLKSTIAAPAGNKNCQKALNGIIGNTRRGIVVDKTLDPDSNNPVANKPVSTALAALAGKIDAALQKPTGLTKTKLVGVGAQGQENIEIGDNLTLANGKLSAMGGKSVPPTLWLIDLDTLKARTTITEEEYNNLKNQLYNQVIYFPDTDYNDAYYLSKLVYAFNEFSFVQCHAVYDDALNEDRIVSLISYSITIGKKDTSGNYPITIKKGDVMPFGSVGGGIPVVEGTFSETTEEGAQFTVNIPQAQSGVFILSLPDITSYFIIGSFAGEYIGNFIAKNGDNPDELIMSYFSGRGTTISLYGKSLLNGGGGNIVTIEVTSMPDTQTTIDVSAITNDTQFVNIKETSTNKNYLLYRVGSDFASCWSNELTQGTIIGFYYIDTQQKQLYYFISSVGKMGKIFGNHDIQVPALSSNNILPCTASDNGKVLSVVNGEAQWATPTSGGGVNGLEADEEGNLTASKNLKVSGNLDIDGSIINKIYKGNDNPTGEMFTTLKGFPGETVHLTQVGDSNSAAGGYPNSWYGRPVRDVDHGCLEVVYSRNKTYLDHRWIQLKLYRHFLKITNGGSLIIINPVHTTQGSCTTPVGLTRLIPGGAIANGVIMNQDGSSSQVIAIEIQDGKPQALLAGGATVDISSYKISDTVSEEQYFYND